MYHTLYFFYLDQSQNIEVDQQPGRSHDKAIQQDS